MPSASTATESAADCTSAIEPAQPRRTRWHRPRSGTRCWRRSSITGRCVGSCRSRCPTERWSCWSRRRSRPRRRRTCNSGALLRCRKPSASRAWRSWRASNSSSATLRCCWCGWPICRGSTAIAAERQAQVEGTHYVEEFIVGVVDAALAAQSALIAAESLGLGGVYIGAMRNLPEQMAAELALPPHAFAVFGMSIGYPDPARETGIKPRLPQSVVLHREQYSAARGARSDRRLQCDDARVPARAGHARDRLDAAVLRPGEGWRRAARARPDARGAAKPGVRAALS